MTPEAQYPFRRRDFFTQRARVRRKQLNINLSHWKQPVPFERFLYITALFWLVLNVPFWATNIVLNYPVNNLVIFAFYIIVTTVYLIVVLVYILVKKYWPVTHKVQVGGGANTSPQFTLKNFIPGEKMDSIELPVEKSKKGERVKIPIEIMICGGVDNLPLPKPKGPIVIARATVRDPKTGNLQAGVLDGKTYRIPCKPKPYIGADIRNYRGFDYFKLASDKFPYKVTPFTRFIIAMDEIREPQREQPAEKGSLEMELYEAKQRIRDLANRLEDYSHTDKGIKETWTGELYE